MLPNLCISEHSAAFTHGFPLVQWPKHLLKKQDSLSNSPLVCRKYAHFISPHHVFLGERVRNDSGHSLTAFWSRALCRKSERADKTLQLGAVFSLLQEQLPYFVFVWNTVLKAGVGGLFYKVHGLPVGYQDCRIVGLASPSGPGSIR